MKKFLKLLFIFLFPIIIGTITFEYLLQKIPNDYAFKKQYLDKNAGEIEVLFLGNSHIFYGVNPEFMSIKSFNCAHGSQSLNYDYALLKKYQLQFKKLKCIVIPIEYQSIYTSIEDGIEKWRVKNYTLYYDIENGDFHNHFELLNGKLLKNIVRVKSYYLNKKSDISCNKLGYGTAFNSKDGKDLEETGLKAAKEHTKLPANKMRISKNQETIDKIIHFAEIQKVKLIFLTCPAYKTYVSKLNHSQLNSTIRYIEKITSKNKNTYYFNFLNDSRFAASDFFDADHLNEIGSKKFTLMIDSLIKKL